MNRRDFLATGGEAVTFALAGGVAGAELAALEPRPISLHGPEERAAAVIREYDAQGNHRTGTDVDELSARWLADRVRQSGAQPALEAFSLSRIDPQSCYLRIGGRRIEGVPLFDGGFTGPEGLRGTLGPLGSDSDIGLTGTAPFKLTEIGAERRGKFAEARESRHKAVILLTGGSKPGLFLLNAPNFSKPAGPPLLQVSSAEAEWLKERADGRADSTVVVHVKRTGARAFNVTTKIPGRDPTLAPIVLMAPRSGWWQCASEQGSRLVCWLEAVRALSAGKPARDCYFVAPSGHELGFLGIRAYLKSRADLIRRAHVWIFFGSSIGEPRQPNLVHASDAPLEQWIVAAMAREGLNVDGRAGRDSTARGEARLIQEGGGRFVTLACGSDAYHNVADRWPESVDVASLARYATAFAKGALELA